MSGKSGAEWQRTWLKIRRFMILLGFEIDCAQAPFSRPSLLIGSHPSGFVPAMIPRSIRPPPVEWGSDESGVEPWTGVSTLCC